MSIQSLFKRSMLAQILGVQSERDPKAEARSCEVERCKLNLKKGELHLKVRDRRDQMHRVVIGTGDNEITCSCGGDADRECAHLWAASNYIDERYRDKKGHLNLDSLLDKSKSDDRIYVD